MFYHDLDPVLFTVGPLSIKWYGVSYIVGFFLAWLVARARAKSQVNWHAEQVTDLIFFQAWGVILGGRLGYWLFYGFNQIIDEPFEIFKIWHGGMSFHGGLIGVVIALIFYCKKHHKPFVEVLDFVALMTPPALFCGRIGNFINGGLYGRTTDVPWAVIFPHSDGLARHPSQLYEAFGEGIVLFGLLWLYSRKPRRNGEITALFLCCYGIIRFMIEYYREPDRHLGFIFFDWMTQGQLLSIPMIVIGISILIWLKFFNSAIMDLRKI